MKLNRDTSAVEVRKAFEQVFGLDIIKVTPDRKQDTRIEVEVPLPPEPVYKNW